MGGTGSLLPSRAGPAIGQRKLSLVAIKAPCRDQTRPGTKLRPLRLRLRRLLRDEGDLVSLGGRPVMSA